LSLLLNTFIYVTKVYTLQTHGKISSQFLEWTTPFWEQILPKDINLYIEFTR